MHICHDVHLILPACTLFCGCCKLLLLVSQLFPQMSDSVLQHLRFASKGRKQECNIPKKVNKLMRKQNHLQTSSNNPGHLCCNVLGMCAGNRSRTCPGAILCRCARAPAVLVQAYAKKHQNCHACCVLDQQASIFFDSSLGESAEEAVHFPFPAKVCSSWQGFATPAGVWGSVTVCASTTSINFLHCSVINCKASGSIAASVVAPESLCCCSSVACSLSDASNSNISECGAIDPVWSSS